MIDISDQHLTLVKQILHTFVPHATIWVFGSRIQGTAKPYSDLDLVMIDQQKIPQKTYYQIMDAFEESELPFRVDVLDWYRISEEFRCLIQSKHVVID